MKNKEVEYRQFILKNFAKLLQILTSKVTSIVKGET